MNRPAISVLGINAAYTKKGPVGQMLEEALDACTQWIEGGGYQYAARVEAIHLADIMEGFTCPQQGEIPGYLQETADKLLHADAVIFATPVFWSMPSALLVQFFADITPFECDGDFPLRGKAAGVIAHCDEDGCEKVVNDVMTPLRHLGFIMPPHAGFWRNRTAARFSENEWQLHDHTHVLASNLIELAIARKQGNPNWR